MNVSGMMPGLRDWPWLPILGGPGKAWVEVGATVGLIADTYDSMQAVGRSADRSVTVTLGGRGGIDVTMADDVILTHTEEQLARQVAGAARLALAAYQRQQKVAIEDAVEHAQTPC